MSQDDETGSEQAKRCFDENLSHFIDRQKDLEKNNLYRGLSLLAKAITDIEITLASIDGRLASIEKKGK